MPTHEGDVLGLRRGAVVLRDSSPRWPGLYEEEAACIRHALGDSALDVEHVGSTAVPGLKAKPILDIAVGVRQLQDEAAYRAPLEALGYEYAPWAGVPDNAVFGRGADRTHLVHVVEYGSPVWSAYLLFRDSLRADPALAREYEALKEELARRYPEDRPAYTAGKGAFVRRVAGA